jgi:hypothetical protein
MASGLWPGRKFAAENLAVRNLIPNVSAVLWRREALLKALDAVPDLADWQLAGDWRLYIWHCWPGRKARSPMWGSS